MRISSNEEKAGRRCITHEYSAVTQAVDLPEKEGRATMQTRQQIDVVQSPAPEQFGDLGAPLRKDIGTQLSEERRQQHQLREELAQACAELEALRAQQSGHHDEELRRELANVRAELEQARDELRLAKEQSCVAGNSKSSDKSPLEALHPSIGLKLSLAAADVEAPVAPQGLSQSELNSLSEPSPDAPNETLTCGLLPTGHPLRVCVKKLRMAPEKENRATMLHPGAPNSWGVPDLAHPPGSEEQDQVNEGDSHMFKQQSSDRFLRQRSAYSTAEEASQLNRMVQQGDTPVKTNGVSDAVARLRSMTAELRGPMVISH